MNPKYAITTALLMLFTFACGAIWQNNRRMDELISRGLAEYALNSKTGAIEFRYVSQPRPPVTQTPTPSPGSAFTPNPEIIGGR